VCERARREAQQLQLAGRSISTTNAAEGRISGRRPAAGPPRRPKQGNNNRSAADQSLSGRLSLRSRACHWLQRSAGKLSLSSAFPTAAGTSGGRDDSRPMTNRSAKLHRQRRRRFTSVHAGRNCGSKTSGALDAGRRSAIAVCLLHQLGPPIWCSACQSQAHQPGQATKLATISVSLMLPMHSYTHSYKRSDTLREHSPDSLASARSARIRTISTSQC